MDEISIIDCITDRVPADQYVWEIQTKAGRKIFGMLASNRCLSDGSISTLIFDLGRFPDIDRLEIPWSAIDTIRQAKEFSPWLTNKRQS